MTLFLETHFLLQWKECLFESLFESLVDALFSVSKYTFWVCLCPERKRCNTLPFRPMYCSIWVYECVRISSGLELEQTLDYFHNIMRSRITRKMYKFVRENIIILVFLIIFGLYCLPLFYGNCPGDNLTENFRLVIKVVFLTTNNEQ